MPKKRVDNTAILKKVATVVLNKAAGVKEPPCARALGGASNVVRAAAIGLQNSDLFSLITAHLVLNHCLNEIESTLETQKYKKGVTDFIDFFAECAREAEKQRQAQEQEQAKLKQRKAGGPPIAETV